MYIIYSIILLAIPSSSYSFSCRYNDSLTISRKTVLLELEDRNYININDAIYDIVLKNETTSFETIPGKNLRYIQNIQFTGYLVQKDVAKHVNVTLKSLVGYRYRKYGKVCRVSFLEKKIKNRKLTIDEEAAILRLAQSCIQSKVCDTDLMEQDRDSDLYYQSVQSSINELVDFYIPKILDSFLTRDKSFEIPTINIATGNVFFGAKNGVVSGLDTVQRTNDIVIKPENPKKFVVNIQLRFSKLKIHLNDISAKYNMVGVYGNLTMQTEGLSFKADITLDLQQQKCSIDFSNIKNFAFEYLSLDIPLWGFRLFSYKFDTHKLHKLETLFLDYVTKLIPELNIPCTKYIEDLFKTSN